MVHANVEVGAVRVFYGIRDVVVSIPIGVRRGQQRENSSRQRIDLVVSSRGRNDIGRNPGAGVASYWNTTKRRIGRCTNVLPQTCIEDFTRIGRVATAIRSGDRAGVQKTRIIAAYLRRSRQKQRLSVRLVDAQSLVVDKKESSIL